MTTPEKRVTAALIALAEHGIPADVQELLVHGNAKQGIAPGAMLKAVEAVERQRLVEVALARRKNRLEEIRGD